jgi:hypothetical protein
MSKSPTKKKKKSRKPKKPEDDPLRMHLDLSKMKEEPITTEESEVKITTRKQPST